MNERTVTVELTEREAQALMYSDAKPHPHPATLERAQAKLLEARVDGPTAGTALADIEEHGMTGQQMCETIAWVEGVDDPASIWNASPTGELAHVSFAFMEACDTIAYLHGEPSMLAGTLRLAVFNSEGRTVPGSPYRESVTGANDRVLDWGAKLEVGEVIENQRTGERVQVLSHVGGGRYEVQRGHRGTMPADMWDGDYGHIFKDSV